MKNQFARTQKFEVDPESEWEQETDGAWFLEDCAPVYREPQKTWKVKPDHKGETLWYVPQIFGDEDSEPDAFPEWVNCIWDSQAGRWVVLPATSSPKTLIGKADLAIAAGSSGTVSIWAKPDDISAPADTNKDVTAFWDWDDVSDIQAGDEVIVVFLEEENIWRVFPTGSESAIYKGTSSSAVADGSSGSFTVTTSGGTSAITASAIGDIAASAKVVVFVGKDGATYAFQPGSSKFCDTIGLAPGSYRANVDQETSAGGTYDITLVDVQYDDQNQDISLTAVNGWGGGEYADGRDVILHVDDHCNTFISNSYPIACDNTLIDGMSYPGELSPAAPETPNATTVGVYIEEDALTAEQKTALGTNNEVTAKWWSDVCPRPAQKVMVHVINCELYATGSIVLGQLETATSSAKVLGVEDGCVVEFDTDESCGEAS